MVSAITDKGLIDQLDAASSASPITDPDLISQLESSASQKPETGSLINDMIGSISNNYPIGFQAATQILAKALGSKDVENLPFALRGSKPSGIEQAQSSIASTLPALGLPEADLGYAGEAISSIPAIGKFLEKTLSTAIPQGGYAALQNPDDALKSGLTAGGIAGPIGAVGQLTQEANPTMRALAKVLLAGGGGLAGYQAGKAVNEPGGDIIGTVLGGYLASHGVNPERAAESSLLKNVNITPDVQQRLDAANRLGLSYLTPAEATLSPYEAARQANIGLTPEGSKLLYDKGKMRVGSEETAINKLLDTVYNGDELTPQKQKIYKETMAQPVTKDFVDQYKDDPLVQHAQNLLDNDPAYKKGMQGVDKNSFEYWDKVKRVLGDMEEQAKDGKGLKTWKANILNRTRNDMVDQMDAMQPQYEDARYLAEREFTRQQLEEAFDKKDVNATNFYKAIQSDKTFNDLNRKLRNVPEAQQSLSDLRLLGNDLISNNPSIRTAAQLSRTSMSKARDVTEGIKRHFNNLFGQRGDVAAVKLMTDPNWPQRIASISQPTNKEYLIGSLIKALGKGAGQDASN